VAKKMIFLALRARFYLGINNMRKYKAEAIEFDDMETFEHTKYKPLSITLAVESKSRRFLGFEVSKMPPKGKSARFAFKKYGIRRDERKAGRRRLFKKISDLVAENAVIKSDMNPHYPRDVARSFPSATHVGFKGMRGSITGQGELKKIRFDPLFSLNHTCAKFRADINRLFRRTWCTTKNSERLADHLALYAHYHNESLGLI
jgi:hypothetical protein